MVGPDSQKGGICWTKIEIATLTIGLVGSAAACLANYGWHLSEESLFYVIWSAVPFGLLLLGNHIARRFVSSRRLQLVTGLLAVALAGLSLMAYTGAVLKLHHSSGMVFFILPLCWMIAIPVVLTGMIVGFLAVGGWRKS